MLPRILPTLFALLVASVSATAQLRPAQVFILIGPPGSGKSAQASYLSKAREIPAISMSSLLKREIGKKTVVGKALASSLASGELVNDQAANDLMLTRLLQPDAGRGFVLDGYPTTEGQAKALDAFLTEHTFPKPIVVILDVPEDVLRQRLASRGRADDEPRNIDRRIAAYRQEGVFTEKWYGPQNVIRVNGNAPVRDVSRAISAGIDKVRGQKGLLTRPPQ